MVSCKNKIRITEVRAFCALYFLVPQLFRLDQFCNRFCSHLDNVHTSILSKYSQHTYSNLNKSTSPSGRNVKRADRVSSVFYRSVAK